MVPVCGEDNDSHRCRRAHGPQRSRANPPDTHARLSAGASPAQATQPALFTLTYDALYETVRAAAADLVSHGVCPGACLRGWVRARARNASVQRGAFTS